MNKPNEQEQLPEINQEINHQIQTNTYRMVFYALLEAAMRYRESYFRDDFDTYYEGLKKANQKPLENAKSHSEERKIISFIKGKQLNFEQKQKKLNDTLYAAIKELEDSLSPAGKTAFDNYSTAYGLMADELAKAKNTTEILTVCKLYNSGAMDSTFDELKKSEYKPGTNPPPAKEDTPPWMEKGLTEEERIELNESKIMIIDQNDYEAPKKETINNQNQETNENNQSITPSPIAGIPLMSEEHPDNSDDTREAFGY